MIQWFSYYATCAAIAVIIVIVGFSMEFHNERLAYQETTEELDEPLAYQGPRWEVLNSDGRVLIGRNAITMTGTQLPSTDDSSNVGCIVIGANPENYGCTDIIASWTED